MKQDQGFTPQRKVSFAAFFFVSLIFLSTARTASAQALCSPGISGSTGEQGVLDPANTDPNLGLVWPAGAVTAFISMGTGEVLFFDSSGLDAGSAFLPGVSGPQPFPDGRLNFISVRLPAGTTVNFASGTSGEGFDTAGLPPPVQLLSCQDVILDSGSSIAGSTRRAIGQAAAHGQESMPGAFPGAVGSTLPLTPDGFGPRLGSVPSAGTLYPPIGGAGGNASGNSSFFSPFVGGGPGGAAFVISASQRITINGSINAYGFHGISFGSGTAQGGAGGSVRLAAVLVDGIGTINTSAGVDSDGVKRSPDGPIEIQAFVQDAFPCTGCTTSPIRGRPVSAALPSNLPTIDIVYVAVTGAGDFCGFDCSNTGSLGTPDVDLLPAATSAQTVDVEAQTTGVPLGTNLVFRAVGTDGSVSGATGTVAAQPACTGGGEGACVTLTLNPGATYQIVVTPSSAFALTRSPEAAPLRGGSLIGSVRPSTVRELGSGSESQEVQAARWARALGADPRKMGAQVARATVRVGGE